MSTHILIMGGIWNTDGLLKNVYSCKTTVFMETDQVSSGLDYYYDRVISFPKGTPIEQWIEMAKFINDQDPIHRIGNYGFYYQDKGVAIAESLDLPIFNNRQAVRCADDKLYMREVLREKGMDSCASELIETKEQLQKFAKKYDYPIIIKPKDGVASRGIFKICNDRELSRAYDQFRSEYPTFEIIVEEFFIGPEFSVETYSEKGKHRVIAITEKFKDEKSFVELGHLIPARLPEGHDYQAIKKYIQNFLSAIEVETGPAHTEIILTEKGARIIETQLRLGGDMIPRLIQLATGIDFWDFTAKQAKGDITFELLPDDLEFYKSAMIVYALPVTPGTFKAFKNIEQAKACKGVDRIDSLKPIGHEFDGVLESSKRACSVIAKGENSDVAIDNALKGLDTLELEIDTAEKVCEILPTKKQLR